MYRFRYFCLQIAISSLMPFLFNSGVAAGPYSDLIVFGDSLSDLGNTSSSSLSLVPGLHYFGGRFSKGLVYSEMLATQLGLGR